jgi:predicted esterase
MTAVDRGGALALATLVACAACASGAAPARDQAPRPAPAASSPPGPAAPSPAAPPPATPSDAPPPASPESARPWPPPPPGVRTDWCIEGVDALDEATCYALPDAAPDALLIYLHGIVPPSGPSPQKTNLETVVTKAARRAGVAALMPRGERGLGPKGQEQWWGWPTGEGSYRRRGPALVAAVVEARRRFEAFTGVAFARVYVAGSSSGAYFVSELALHGGLRADGYAAISGGAARPTAELASLPPTPFYIGYGTHDPAANSARALAALLRHAGWPVRIEAHPVPHGAHEVYLDEAFAFFRGADR